METMYSMTDERSEVEKFADEFLKQAEVLFVDLQEKYPKACGNSLDNWRNYIVDGVDDIVVSNE